VPAVVVWAQCLRLLLPLGPFSCKCVRDLEQVRAESARRAQLADQAMAEAQGELEASRRRIADLTAMVDVAAADRASLAMVWSL
jgi:hypothetical protein